MNQRRSREPSPREGESRRAGESSRANSSSRTGRPSRASQSPRNGQSQRKQATVTYRKAEPTRRTSGSKTTKPPQSAIDEIAQKVASQPRIAAIAAGVVLLLIVILCFTMCGRNEKPADSDQSQASTFHRNEGPYAIAFSSTGDLMFGREVGTFVDANGGAAALANVADELSAANVTIANVEAPLTNDESDAIVGKDVYWMSRPAGIDALKKAGIDVVSLANNHIMDYGATGLKDTLNALDGAGIQHAGAGVTEQKAGEPVELEVDGVKIAFFSWTDVIPDNFLAFGENAGVVSARMNMDDACKRVKEAKETHDIVIVAMHWGVEYQPYIDEAQQQIPAHKLVDAGADVIVGNHPHVIEGIEFYNNALISYSQGDFVCDHYSQETGESFILNFTITQDGIRDVSAIPVYLDDTYGIPSIVTGEHAQSILSRLEKISTGMNSSFTIRDDVAYISPSS